MLESVIFHLRTLHWGSICREEDVIHWSNKKEDASVPKYRNEFYLQCACLFLEALSASLSIRSFLGPLKPCFSQVPGWQKGSIKMTWNPLVRSMRQIQFQILRPHTITEPPRPKGMKHSRKWQASSRTFKIRKRTLTQSCYLPHTSV